MSDIEIIKEKLDIVDVISRYVDLKSAGSNMRGLCPFHQEKSPSFMVNPSLQIFKCFGCGKGGDIFSFIREIERLDFPEALSLAAEWAGVTLSGNYSHKDDKQEKEKEIFYEINRLTADFFHHLLMSHKIGKKALEYAMEKRKLDSKILKKLHYGYAPDGYENLKQFLLKKGYKEDILLKVGILIERDGKTIDKFRNRLMQPIHDLKGNIVGFSGRYLGDFKGAPKYLNSSESLIYKKNELLYGLYFAKEAIRKEKKVIIVEGNIDIASSHKVGIENIVAPLGTAFTANQGRLLKRFAEELLFAFDTDSAGIGAVVRGLTIAEDLGIAHKVLDIGDFGDVDDLIKADPNKWKEVIANPVNTVDYLRKIYSRDLDLGTVDGKLNFKKRIIPVLKVLKNEIMKSHYSKEISNLLDIPREILIEEIEKSSATKILPHRDIEELQPNSSEPQNLNTVSAMLKYENYLLAVIIQNKKSELIDKDLISIFEDSINIDLLNSILNGNFNVDNENASIKIRYEEISLIDISDVEKTDLEIKKLIRILRKHYLESKMAQIKKEMISDGENDELIMKLAEVTKEISKL